MNQPSVNERIKIFWRLRDKDSPDELQIGTALNNRFGEFEFDLSQSVTQTENVDRVLDDVVYASIDPIREDAIRDRAQKLAAILNLIATEIPEPEAFPNANFQSNGGRVRE